MQLLREALRGAVRLVVAVLVACAAALVVAACGSSSHASTTATTSSSGGSTSSGTTVSATNGPAVAASGGCGTLPEVAPLDPAGVIKSLASSYQPNYVGFTDFPVVPSAWSKWKPATASGWSVQIVWAPLTNSFQTNTLQALQAALKASGKVASIQVQTPATVQDVPQQLQELGTAIQRKPTIIVYEPLASAPGIPLIAKAAAAGIPIISAWNSTASKYAINVALDPYLNSGLPAAGVLGLMHGTGSVLEVHGVPDTQVDVDAFNAFAKALSRCPSAKVAGTVTGDYASPVAKAAVQQFLATHPAGVQGVFEAGVMSLGILQAFEQTGHTPPPVADPGTVQGVIAYWQSHSNYNEVATAAPDTQYGHAFGDVTLRVLEGQGVKLNTLLQAPYIVTRSNLGQVWQSSFQANSPVDAAGPAGNFMPDSYLNGFFSKPATP